MLESRLSCPCTEKLHDDNYVQRCHHRIPHADPEKSTDPSSMIILNQSFDSGKSIQHSFCGVVFCNHCSNGFKIPIDYDLITKPERKEQFIEYYKLHTRKCIPHRKLEWNEVEQYYRECIADVSNFDTLDVDPELSDDSDVAVTSARPQSPIKAVARLDDDASDGLTSVDVNEHNEATQSAIGKVDTTVSPEFPALSDGEDDDAYKQEYTESDFSDHNLASDIDGESELDGLKVESSSAVKFGVALRPRNFENQLLFQARKPCPPPYVARERGGIVSVQLYCIYKFIHVFT